MKRYLTFALLPLAFASLASCGGNSATDIVVGASPSPHVQILSCDAVQNYVKAKGYTLTIKEYQDYVMPNQALNSGALDANYFQHIPYLEQQIADFGYDFKALAKVHNEPLNLYGTSSTPISTKEDAQALLANKTVSIINDGSNVERAYKLLQSWGIIDTYSVKDFDAAHLVYTTSIGVTLESFDGGLLHSKVEDGGYAVINGNYALNAWSTEKATAYRLFGESQDAAYPNVIVSRAADAKSEKMNVLLGALAQPEVGEFIAATFGPTVSYCYEDIR